MQQIGMATRNVPCLVIVIFSDEVVAMTFLLLSLDRYILSVVIDNRHIPRGSTIMYFLLLLLRM